MDKIDSVINKIEEVIISEKKELLNEKDEKELLKEEFLKLIDFEKLNKKEIEKLISKTKNILIKQNKLNFIDLYYTEKGYSKPLLTRLNIEILLKHENYIIYYDEIRHNLIVIDNNMNEFRIQDISSYFEDKITKYDFMNKNYNVLLRKIAAIGLDNKINPVKDYILNSYNKNKDKIKINNEITTSELDKIFNSMKMNEEELEINYLLFKTWMTSLVASQFNSEFKSQGALTFCGQQGSGKSTWFSNLIPKHLSKYFKEEFALYTNDKDNRIESTQFWLVELSELGRSIKDSDRAKSHITKQYDTYRVPYAPEPEKHKRITVYGASVDKDEFLKDDVNRRWWTIKINDRFDLIEINHELLYTELYTLYLQNPKKCHELDWSGIKKLNQHNLQFSISDDCDSIILNMFNWENPIRYLVPSSDIANLINKEKINNYKIGISLSKINTPFEVINKKTKQKLYHIPEPRKILSETYQKFKSMNYTKVNNYEDLERETIQNENIIQIDSKKASK